MTESASDAANLAVIPAKARSTRFPGKNVARLAGKPVRLRFVLTDADLYAIRFKP